MDSMEGYHFPVVMIRCERAPAARVILHCHANACDVGHVYEMCQRDAECWQANVLLVEYPGYGDSPGVSYERSVDRHVTVAYLYLMDELKYKPENVVLFGRSLGSGPVCRLAQRLQETGDEVGGIVLHSPFVSVREAGLALVGHVAHMMTDRWDNREPMGVIKCRMLIIHGVSDEVVPFFHSEILRDVRKAANLPCSLFPTQGTHNYFSYYRDYLQPVERFLAGHEKSELPELPDPLPMAEHSRAQVREIFEEQRRVGATDDAVAIGEEESGGRDESSSEKHENVRLETASPDSTLEMEKEEEEWETGVVVGKAGSTPAAKCGKRRQEVGAQSFVLRGRSPSIGCVSAHPSTAVTASV